MKKKRVKYKVGLYPLYHILIWFITFQWRVNLVLPLFLKSLTWQMFQIKNYFFATSVTHVLLHQFKNFKKKTQIKYEKLCLVREFKHMFLIFK